MRPPGPACLQRISNPHQRQAPTAFSAPGCLQGSKPTAAPPPGRRHLPLRGEPASFALGVSTTSRDPKTVPPTPQRFLANEKKQEPKGRRPSWLSATFPLRRRAALSCHPPGVHCGSGCIAGCRRCGWGQFLGGSSVVTSREIRVKCRLARWEEGLFCTCVDKKSILPGKTPSPNWVATRGGSSGRPQRSSSATEMPTP